jgi:hypothetical protein
MIRKRGRRGQGTKNFKKSLKESQCVVFIECYKLLIRGFLLGSKGALCPEYLYFVKRPDNDYDMMPLPTISDLKLNLS